MFYKYYSYNIIVGDFYCGSRVLRVYFFTSPMKAMKLALLKLPEDKAIVDFKRIY